MIVSVFELFTVGIGPSSSHTVGPMRAARSFISSLSKTGCLGRVSRVQVELYGSLAATGAGHGTDRAVLLGLEGHAPETVDPALAMERMRRLREDAVLSLLAEHDVPFDPEHDLVLHPRETLPFHPNGLRFHAYDERDRELATRTSYSVGGGFVVDAPDEDGTAAPAEVRPGAEPAVPHPFRSAADLLTRCRETGLPISELTYANECSLRDPTVIRAHLAQVWAVMQECVEAGCRHDGVLPGGLKVRRRAPELHRRLSTGETKDPLVALDWVSLFAMAVNEENAAGGRVVTAPTNGAAGILPAVLHYYVRFCAATAATAATAPAATGELDAVERFLLTAAAVGSLYKQNASISGAEVGCQGEVGSASSMAAAGLCEVLGGTPEQVENAAEIAMEHNLGLTCDPVGGLVQIPCIERNAMGAAKAINAVRLALHGDGQHMVSLDQVIRTMRQTGADMKSAYKETSLAGLAVNVVDC